MYQSDKRVVYSNVFFLNLKITGVFFLISIQISTYFYNSILLEMYLQLRSRYKVFAFIDLIKCCKQRRENTT